MWETRVVNIAVFLFLFFVFGNVCDLHFAIFPDLGFKSYSWWGDIPNFLKLQYICKYMYIHVYSPEHLADKL